MSGKTFEPIPLRDIGSDSYVSCFVAAYVECAIWSESARIIIEDDGSISEAPDNDRSFLDLNFGPDDLSEEARSEIERDCRAFIDHARALLWRVHRVQASRSELVYRESGSTFEDDCISSAGHDFWLTRNHHGAGYWDRGYPSDLGRLISEAAHSFGDASLYWIEATSKPFGEIGYES